MPGVRVDQATIEARVEEVYRLLLSGATRVDILQFVAKTNPPWGISNRQAENYIAKAYKRFELIVEKRHERIFNKHYARREDLYAKSLNQGNIPAAAGVLKDLDAYLGMYPTMLTQEKVAGIVKQFMDAAVECIPADKLSAFLARVESVLYQVDPDGRHLTRPAGATDTPGNIPSPRSPDDEDYSSDLDTETLDTSQPPGHDSGPVGDGTTPDASAG